MADSDTSKDSISVSSDENHGVGGDLKPGGGAPARKARQVTPSTTRRERKVKRMEALREYRAMKKAERKEARASTGQGGNLGGGGGEESSGVAVKCFTPTHEALLFRLELAFRLFLEEDTERFSLPRGLTVHQAELFKAAAEYYGLKKRKQGSGMGKYTILVKTKHTDTSKPQGMDPFARYYSNKDKPASAKEVPREDLAALSAGLGAPGSGPPTLMDGGGGLGMDSLAAKMMQSMGWRSGEGLGRASQGMAEPILPSARPDRSGIGCQ